MSIKNKKTESIKIYFTKEKKLKYEAAAKLKKKPLSKHIGEILENNDLTNNEFNSNDKILLKIQKLDATEILEKLQLLNMELMILRGDQMTAILDERININRKIEVITKWMDLYQRILKEKEK